MAIRNFIVLRLLGVPSEATLTEWPDANGPEDNLIFAMYLADSLQIGALETFLHKIDDIDDKALSHWCLFLAMSRDPTHGMALFDSLKSRFPLSPAVWADLAALQSATGYAIGAARSLAIHAELVGACAPLPALPFDQSQRGDVRGSVRFVYGDASNFCGV